MRDEHVIHNSTLPRRAARQIPNADISTCCTCAAKCCSSADVLAAIMMKPGKASGKDGKEARINREAAR